MRELTTAEIGTVSGGLTPAEGITATLGVLGVGAFVGIGAPVFAFGVAAITAMAVIDMIRPTSTSGTQHLGSAGGPSDTKDACA